MTSKTLSFSAVPEIVLSSEDEGERFRIIAQTLERLRPAMQADGGDLELVSVEGYKVKVRLKGACAGCGASNETLGGIRRILAAALGGGPVLVVPAL